MLVYKYFSEMEVDILKISIYDLAANDATYSALKRVMKSTVMPI